MWFVGRLLIYFIRISYSPTPTTSTTTEKSPMNDVFTSNLESYSVVVVEIETPNIRSVLLTFFFVVDIL